MDEMLGYQHQPKFTAKELAERRKVRMRIAEAAAALPPAALPPAAAVAAAAEGPDDHDPEDRREDTRWCQCGYCNYVPRNASLKMCVCCQEQEYPGLREKLDGADHIIACITRHSDFKAISLTNAVLEMMEAYTRERRGYQVNQGWTNRLYRLLAYQSYTYWIHQYLGRKNRRVIPACVVNIIREKWPEENDEDYVSYKENEDEIGDIWEL